MGGAPTSANFGFLHGHDPLLVSLGALAERYFADDPATSLLKVRQYAEVLAQHTAANLGLPRVVGEQQIDLLQRLRTARALTPEVHELFGSIRRAGNAAAHQVVGSHRDALHCLKLARELGIWFHRSFGGGQKFNPGPFLPPADPATATKELHGELARLDEDSLGDVREAQGRQASKAHAEVTTNASINRNLKLLRAVLKYALELGLIDLVPRIQLLPEDDATPLVPPGDKVLAEIVAKAESYRSVAPLLPEAIAFAVETGVRAGEQFHLTWKSIEWNVGGKKGRVLMRIEEQSRTRLVHGQKWVPKNRRSRSVPL